MKYSIPFLFLAIAQICTAQGADQNWLPKLVSAVNQSSLSELDSLVISEEQYASMLLEVKRWRMESAAKDEVFLSDSALIAAAPDFRRQIHQNFTMLTTVLVQTNHHLKSWTVDTVITIDTATASPSNPLSQKFELLEHRITLTHGDMSLDLVVHTVDNHGTWVTGLELGSLYPTAANSSCGCYQEGKQINAFIGKSATRMTRNRYGVLLEQLHRHCTQLLGTPTLDLRSLEKDCD